MCLRARKVVSVIHMSARPKAPMLVESVYALVALIALFGILDSWKYHEARTAHLWEVRTIH